MNKSPHQVAYGTTTIHYRLRRTRRRTLAIHVHPDGSVEVDAPLEASVEAIDSRVRRRGRWIVRQQRQFAEYPPTLPHRRFESGESVRYLGRQYRLRVESGEPDSVKLKGEFLLVRIIDPGARDRVARLVADWYRRQARRVFGERLPVCQTLTGAHGIPPPRGWRLMTMAKRWGSCTREGNILLNPELVQAPRDCIDYVIVHELCHLAEPHHGPAFQRLLAREPSAWQECKSRLERGAELRRVE